MTIGWRYRWIDVIVSYRGLVGFYKLYLSYFYLVAPLIWSYWAMVYFRIQALGISFAGALLPLFDNECYRDWVGAYTFFLLVGSLIILSICNLLIISPYFLCTMFINVVYIFFIE